VVVSTAHKRAKKVDEGKKLSLIDVIDSSSEDGEEEGDSDVSSEEHGGNDDEDARLSMLYDALDAPITFLEPSKLKFLKI
jgi:hypothetical protein